ncbi:hypothetical protein B0T26DRAFT_644611 [Lasiosphaeria miniovina]|uniref:Uncharacterized protein n=1 Tax=Lasiosphaeria miniovina TaxID=1954250 RepID=A0AA40ATZ8_9PEZI|nr:uncharacterized protein B0T26DRAFT_644611 [Lasiosphaeria miniovina]KAK0721946.1 hypothetical protein B0T26DRAFT_644611 [Lasiosphaeria miniovina]
MTSNMPSQRPFFLSTFFAAFRQQTPSSLSAGAAGQPNKHTTPAAGGPSTYGSSPSAPRSIANNNATTQAASSSSGSRSGGVMGQLPLHSPRGPHNIPIPQQQQQGGARRHHHHHHGRRRGSDSSSEGFRETLGAEKLYIGGRTATGEEKFFKLGVIRRVRSGDRLSLDRLSL